MRKILKYVLEFQKHHFDWKLYLSVAVFLLISFVFNYTLDFEDAYIDTFRDTFWHWLFMFLWMALPFVVISFILFWHKKEVKLNRKYWVVLVIGFAVLAFDRSFSWYESLYKNLEYIDRKFLSKCLFWCSSLLTNVLPLMMIYRMMEDDYPKTYYGLQWKRFDFKPYFQMLGIAILLIGVGSFFSDLQSYYPRYQFSKGEQFGEAHDLASWIPVMIYELCYGSDFVAVEVFFRGFLIHAFARTLGGYAVLAMVGSYAYLHFGKPLTEAVSSVFGGYLLGIVSYYTRSVWGGVVVHMGVAWTMEIFGYLHKIY